MDGKTDRIHAVVKKDELEIWEAELKEHSTYYMYNFKVVANDGQYQVCSHPFKLLFTGGTTLRQDDLPDIPLKSYHYKSFEEIVNGNYDLKILIDIIGMVEEVKFQLPSGNPPKVVFNLKDLSGQVISCTLWSNHASKFMFYLKDNADAHYIVIVVTQARIKPP